MNNAPNPSRRHPRYQMIRELGRNLADGRITYLARDHQSQQLVVIKQFVFAQSNTDGLGFKAYEPEIQVLQALDHSGIPRYIDSFETKAGFCLVQQYKNVQSLAIPRHFRLDQIQQIASLSWKFWFTYKVVNNTSKSRGVSHWLRGWSCYKKS